MVVVFIVSGGVTVVVVVILVVSVVVASDFLSLLQLNTAALKMMSDKPAMSLPVPLKILLCCIRGGFG